MIVLGLIEIPVMIIGNRLCSRDITTFSRAIVQYSGLGNYSNSQNAEYFLIKVSESVDTLLMWSFCKKIHYSFTPKIFSKF